MNRSRDRDGGMAAPTETAQEDGNARSSDRDAAASAGAAPVELDDSDLDLVRGGGNQPINVNVGSAKS